jgi:uncharacterized protein DUF5658
MLLLQFAALQVLDALSTLWLLHRGVTEANPLLRWAFAWCAQPALALAVAKSLSLLPAAWAWRTERYRVLRIVNLVFVGCVAWNLIALGLTFAGGTVR